MTVTVLIFPLACDFGQLMLFLPSKGELICQVSFPSLHNYKPAYHASNRLGTHLILMYSLVLVYVWD